MLSPKIKFADRDEYGRVKIAHKIEKLLKSDIPISPLLIDGRWGQGKTEFCYKMINQLKESEKNCVYIDAYQNDHIDDPLLMIFSAILAHIADPEEKTKLMEKALPVVSLGLKVAGRALVAWGLKQDAGKIADEFDSVIKQSSDDIFNEISEKIISGYVKKDKNLSALILALKAATESNELVIFLDELDRCRPSFAVEVIEKIKHVFDIPGITFVLVANNEQLVAAINNIYGELIDAEDYINKFVKLTIRLNQFFHNQGERALNSAAHFKTILESLEDLSFMDGPPSYSYLFAKHLIELNDLSLRQVERLVLRIQATNIVSDPQLIKQPIGLQLGTIAMIFLECVSPSEVDKINQGMACGSDLMHLFNIDVKTEYTGATKYFVNLLELWDLTDSKPEVDLPKHLRSTYEGLLYHLDNSRTPFLNMFINIINNIRFS